ncbi:MAG: hypothetical protein ACTSW1_10830 [Candidatus Hodarchaeales archaeon]
MVESGAKEAITRSREELDFEHIKKILERNPFGLGFNQMAEILDGSISEVTLKKRLRKMIKLEYVRREPKDWRRGQQKKYILTEGYEKHINFIYRIEEATKKYISELYDYKEKIKEVIKEPVEEKAEINIFHKYRYLLLKIRQFYSIPYIIGSIHTWNYRWTRDPESIMGILALLYTSYLEVDKVVEEVNNEIDEEFNKVYNEIREYVKDKYPDALEDFDKIDLEQLNIYQNPKHILDVLDSDFREKVKENQND